jgi:hypothetical protein
MSSRFLSPIGEAPRSHLSRELQDARPRSAHVAGDIRESVGRTIADPGCGADDRCRGQGGDEPSSTAGAPERSRAKFFRT